MYEYMDLLDYNPDSSIKIVIEIPDDIVLSELKNLREITFLDHYVIGNHNIKISKEKFSKTEKINQYNGLFWLLYKLQEKHRYITLHVEAISKFHLFRLALTIVTLKVAGKKDKDLLPDEKRYRNVKITYDGPSNISEVTFNNLIVKTKLFGEFRAPSKSELEMFTQKYL